MSAGIAIRDRSIQEVEQSGTVAPGDRITLTSGSVVTVVDASTGAPWLRGYLVDCGGFSKWCETPDQAATWILHLEGISGEGKS